MIKDINDEIEILENQYEEIMLRCPFGCSYPDYLKFIENNCGDINERIIQLRSIRRKIIEPGGCEDIPDYGDVMPLSDFVDCCLSGGFINYDGYGRYVKDNKMYDIEIYPSDVKRNNVRTDFDTIIWFNR